MAAEKGTDTLGIEQVTPRLPGEPKQAFAAFVAYRDLGPERTINAVAESSHRGPSILFRWSRTWNWGERTKLFDENIDRVRLRAMALAAAKEASKWERRRQDCLERAFLDAEALRVKAREMLRVDAVREVVDADGGRTTHPSDGPRWTFRDAGMILKTSVEIQAAVLHAVDKEFETIGEAELRAIAGLREADPADLGGETGPLPTPGDSTPDGSRE
jgi:hypothetical protein